MTEECLSIVQWLKNWFTSTDDLIDKTYPVGAIYMSVNNTSPSTLFGGTWVQLTDTFLYASNTADTDRSYTTFEINSIEFNTDQSKIYTAAQFKKDIEGYTCPDAYGNTSLDFLDE